VAASDGDSVRAAVDNVLCVNYRLHVIEVRQTVAFADWVKTLKDRIAVKKIAQRIVRVQSGLMGDVKLFDGIGELRIDFGPGYRVYFVSRGDALIILLCGGDKASQSGDIARAIDMAKEV
jgi:putative addiction module killer protein